MATTWSTQYPTDLDTTTQQPTIAGGDTDASQINTVAEALQALEAQVGSDIQELTSLWGQVTRSSPLPWMTWATVNTVTVQPAPGYSECALQLQDGKIRTFSGSLTFNKTTTGQGGMDSGTGGADEWLYLYVVPDAGDDDLLEVVGSNSSPTSGPIGYTEHQYIGVCRTNSSNQILQFDQCGATFYIRRTEDYPILFQNSSFSPSTGSWQLIATPASGKYPPDVTAQVFVGGAMDSDTTSSNSIQIVCATYPGTPIWTPPTGSRELFMTLENQSRETNTITLSVYDGNIYFFWPQTNNPVEIEVGVLGWTDRYIETFSCSPIFVGS